MYYTKGYYYTIVNHYLKYSKCTDICSHKTNNMKKITIAYWVSTGMISLMMLMSSFMYFSAPEVKEGFTHLGYPDYFRVELGFAKFLGAAVLLLPMINGRIKEWAYFGFFVTFVSAFVAHTISGDPASKAAGPVIALVLLLISYFMYQKKYNSQLA